MGNIQVLRLRNTQKAKKRDDQSLSSSGSRHQQYVFGTLCLNSYANVGKALKDSSKSSNAMVPRRIQVGGKFLNTMTDFPSAHHKQSLRRVLRRGCVDLVLVGNNPQAPRRVYEGEINFVLERLQRTMIEGVRIENLDIHPQPQGRSSRRLLDNLQKLSNLQRIVIESTRMEASLLEDVLQVLEKLPCLKEITFNVLDLKDNQVGNLEKTLARLLQTSNTLESISLPQYPATEDFWKGVTASKSIQSLSLPCHDSTRTEDLSRIQQLLLEDTQLQSLELRQIHSETKWELLTDGLRRNVTLEALHMTLEDRKGVTPLLEEMTLVLKHHNFCLRQFELHSTCDSDDESQATRNMRVPTDECDFYTQLNRHSTGRFHLLRQDPSREEWKQALAESASEANISTLYYWLRAQPTLLPAQ